MMIDMILVGYNNMTFL